MTLTPKPTARFVADYGVSCTSSLPAIARALLFWWPHMVEHENASAPGAAWTISHRVPAAPEGGIRLVSIPSP